MAFNFRTIIIVAAVICAASCTNAAKKHTWNDLIPQDGKPVAVASKKGHLDYFALDSKNISTIKVTGPGVLKVLMRAVVTGTRKKVNFEVVAIRDDEPAKTISRSARHSKTTLAADTTCTLTKTDSVLFKVPEGDHIFHFSLPSDSKSQVYARFRFSDISQTNGGLPKAKIMIAYLPRKFDEEVRILVKEQEYIYYRASADRPVEIEAIGPTQFKGVSRIEFDPTMHGEKPYRIQVSEEGKVLDTSPFTGKISAVATYSKPSDKVIGEGDTFFIDVPAGKHRYQVATPDKGTFLLLRFYLPQKDLGNEWKPDKTNGSAGVIPSQSHPSKG